MEDVLIFKIMKFILIILIVKDILICKILGCCKVKSLNGSALWLFLKLEKTE